MLLMDQELAELVRLSKEQGFLTYDEINDYLPDEDESPEKLNRLIAAVERFEIKLIDGDSIAHKLARRPEPNVREMRSQTTGTEASGDQASLDDEMPGASVAEELASVDMPKASDDPIRMYLSQMAEIPLLSREEEISLAKKIEVTRRQFRRSLLESDYALRHTVEVLHRVHLGELPFDRTIKVSLTEHLTKEQVSARMPHNLRTLDTLIRQNREDFDTLTRKSTPPRLKAEVRRRFLARRRKCLELVEELSLRSRRVTPMLERLEEFSNRMCFIRRRLSELGHDAVSRDEAADLRQELRELMTLTQETPESLKIRVTKAREHF